jgi:hypothetical protein
VTCRRRVPDTMERYVERIERKNEEADHWFDEALHNGEKLLDELKMVTVKFDEIPDELDDDILESVRVARDAMAGVIASRAKDTTEYRKKMGEEAVADVVVIVEDQNDANRRSEDSLDEAISINGRYGQSNIANSKEKLHENIDENNRIVEERKWKNADADEKIDMVMDKIYQIRDDR